jgi:glutamate synthase domain-containing protein 3
MATKLITVPKAEAEIRRLQQYITLVVEYQADTLEKWIIKEYAYTNSITEVVKRATTKGMNLDLAYAKSVLKGNASDEIHKILRSGYLARLKPKKERLC